MTKVLVTGPTGPAGEYVLERLMTTEDEVRVLALPDSMHRVNYRDRIEMVPGHLHDAEALAEAVEGVEIIYHAALVGPKPGLDPDYQIHVNAGGTAALARAAEGRVRRVVMVSTNNVYAPHRSPAVWPVPDDALRLPHGTPAQTALGESMIAAEDALIEAGERGAFEYSVLRPTLVAGRTSRFMDNMVTGILRGTANLEVQRRMWDVMQWVHGTDVANAALLVARAPEAANRAFVVAGETPVTIYDIQSLLWDILNTGRDEENPYLELARENNLGLRKFDSARLKALGWKPRVSIRQCLMEILGRLEFFSSASLQLPPHMVDE